MRESGHAHHPSVFARAWHRSFGVTPPLGDRLRADFPERWTRFHALPGSKRYSESAAEKQIILDRANTLASDCFGNSDRVWVAAGYLKGSPLNPNCIAKRMAMRASLEWADEAEEITDREEFEFYVVETKWEPSSFDVIFDEIAEDRDRAIIFDAVTGTVLAPYDGGFDLVSLQPRIISELEKKHRSWMSDRLDKL